MKILRISILFAVTLFQQLLMAEIPKNTDLDRIEYIKNTEGFTLAVSHEGMLFTWRGITHLFIL